MLRSWRIGKAFGIDLFVHWSFLLAPGLVLFSNLNYGVGAALMGVFITLAIFGCVVLHELGHALMARIYGIDTRDITLYPIGGVARLECMPEQPKAEIAIALAGPAVNVAIAGGLWIGLMLAGLVPSLELFVLGSIGQVFLMNILVANIALVIFNMIPAFPMDGGRVLRAVLALFTDRLRATELAANIGVVFAGLFVIGGLVWHAPTLLFVGIFVLFAGQQERMFVRAIEYQRRMRQYSGPTITVEPTTHVSTLTGVSGFAWDPERRVWVLWNNGQPVGAYSVEDAGRL
jgi:Zn-dependent protease